MIAKLFTAWKEQQNSLIIDIDGLDLIQYNKFLTSAGLPIAGRELVKRIVNSVAFFSKGCLGITSIETLPLEITPLLERFAIVFDLTYTRFLDLKQAEDQAHEAKIELALERVRARTMAMQKSDELAETAVILYEQLYDLGNIPEQINIGIVDDNKDTIHWWVTEQGGKQIDIRFTTATTGPETLNKIYDCWKTQRKSAIVDSAGDELTEWLAYMRNEVGLKLKEDLIKNHRVNTVASFTDGVIAFTTPEIPSPETVFVLEKFASVFNLAYTRFLDLQKAEAQTRLAQIELGLERVRAKAMAMKKSEELSGVISTVFIELTKLDFSLTRTMLWFFDENSDSFEVWMANSETDKSRGSMRGPIEHPYHKRLLQVWKERKTKWVYELRGDEKKNLDDYLFTQTAAQYLPEEVKAGVRAPEIIINSFSFHNFGGLQADGLQELTEENLDILYRFSKEFDLTYTRFLDLQKAEAQAKEAKIEASLERVRGKAMAMHSSEDLDATISVFYHELETLSVTPRRCGVGLVEKESRIVEISSMNTTDQGNAIKVIGKLVLSGNAVLEGIYDHWRQQIEYYPVLRGIEIKDYYALLQSQIAYPDYTHDAVQFGYFFSFPEGAVYAWTEKELIEEELKIYRRFTSVLSLTYKRYQDLKNAEARAQIAIKEATLDRVRGEIASMRTADDLQRITPLVWRELTALGVPFFRCGLFILDAINKKIYFYLSTPDGKPLAALQLEYNHNETTINAVNHWRLQKVYTEHWGKEQFVAFTQSLIKQRQIQTSITFQGGEEPPESLQLLFVPFTQGMMYVGSAEPLATNQVELVQALADTFSTAYARYEDFTKLEAAKAQVEHAFKDLRATQTQLIQSEKMASLGELTAGIAHEIQNPLNFVNNFSEVSNELIKEIQDIRNKTKDDRDEGLTDDLLNDIEQNLEKINHHGKRADAIVKGMLQHSRSSSGVKEPADINALCDEYLRLSYHGLRAKDKLFNTKFATDFDSSLPKINVVPQDIGRVILNLLTNAFYAVNEKTKLNIQGYESMVIISTRRVQDKVEIKVSDNGNGIPQKVLDKIFQPFFTTKPTGQGTGLGLSLSYDIIKAHGGEIKVSTAKGEGAEFIIVVPINY